MRIDEVRRTRLTRSALSDHDQQLVDVLCQLYERVGESYHRSDTYQGMVKRYPALATAIERCRRDALVPGDPQQRTSRAIGARATPLLWERSHGER